MTGRCRDGSGAVGGMDIFPESSKQAA
jgi:hypothetical protein